MCYPGNASNNLWVADLLLDLLVMHQAEFTINYYSLNLAVIHCVTSSLADLSYSFATANPSPLSCLHASCRVTNLHRYCIHYFELQLKTVFMLARTKLFCSHYCSALHFCTVVTRYITTSPTTENIFTSIVGTCILSHCIATVATLPLLRYWAVT
jgi:hypothetical protein